MFNVGDCVQHKVFGKGMVMKAEKMGNDTMLEIAFDKAGTKTLMANYCSNMKKSEVIKVLISSKKFCALQFLR